MPMFEKGITWSRHYCSKEQLEPSTSSISMSLISSTKLVLDHILDLVLESQKQYYSLKGHAKLSGL
jgi:hypothetical protein